MALLGASLLPKRGPSLSLSLPPPGREMVNVGSFVSVASRVKCQSTLWWRRKEGGAISRVHVGASVLLCLLIPRRLSTSDHSLNKQSVNRRYLISDLEVLGCLLLSKYIFRLYKRYTLSLVLGDRGKHSCLLDVVKRQQPTSATCVLMQSVLLGRTRLPRIIVLVPVRFLKIIENHYTVLRPNHVSYGLNFALSVYKAIFCFLFLFYVPYRQQETHHASKEQYMNFQRSHLCSCHKRLHLQCT